MKKVIYISITLSALILSACGDYYDTQNNPVTYGETYLDMKLSTDKASYAPDETVTFTLKNLPSGAKVRYFYLDEAIDSASLTDKTWTWTPPAEDYKGYMAAVYTTNNSTEELYTSIAVDVSSDWTKFPRYGFLSDYSKMSQVFIDNNIERLNRYHINGLQFYDWLYDHQRPLAGTAENPASSWLDIFDRTNYLSTVQGYIAAAQSKNIKTMFYNLCYGALDDAASDGVEDAWYVYTDQQHGNKDYHELSSGRSNIYIVNPANTDWQQYLVKRNNDVYSVFGFDGYHIDQLGYRGDRYDYDGNSINMTAGYGSFINAMKTAEPNKNLVFNAVGGYGQSDIANADVDFLYAEVWGARSGDEPENSYADLISLMRDNVAQSNSEKNIVLAAYMDYDISTTSGYVNKPGILLADASIFAWGGAHLELGEHYLTNEYFPNDNLQMKSDLGQALVNYYDFLVAYENLLRDGGEFQAADVTFLNESITAARWPADKGQVATIGKKVNGKDVIHLINFTDANSMQWRDSKGTQAEPTLITAPSVSIPVSGTVSKVWFASPDINNGLANNLPFTQSGDQVTVTLPSLKYWDMIVVEY
ncbi:MAG: glycoside hydrolase family 66 protein [Paludibacter sp.]|nr:glycoside hydrolase family 66 protein [Paludibacter sp.]